nr:MAG TPA: hypothetical protein [Caudoviricetes sp.]
MIYQRFSITRTLHYSTTTQRLLFCTSAIFRTHDSTPHTTQHFTVGFQL